MVSWNIWKSNFHQDIPNSLEPSIYQHEARSICWLFQRQTFKIYLFNQAFDSFYV